jgi:hypothetical protein
MPSEAHHDGHVSASLTADDLQTPDQESERIERPCAGRSSMSWLRVIVFSAVSMLAWPVAAADLTTHDLVALHRAGLGDEVLVALVEADGGPFHLSHAEILDLRAEGLSDRVLAAMIRAGRHGGTAVYAQQPEFPPPATSALQPAYGGRHTFGFSMGIPVGIPVAVPVAAPILVPGYGVPAIPAGDLRHRPVVTVDSIRHAPPGFHPGTSAPDAQPGAAHPATAQPGTPRAGRPPASGAGRVHPRPAS